MASVNLMIGLPSRDPDSARALLGDMHDVADRRCEPAQWERWANAANNLMFNLRSRDPDAARAFLEELPPDDFKWLELVIEQASGQALQS